MINDANVIVADVLASNGIVHVIDAVLIPSEEREWKCWLWRSPHRTFLLGFMRWQLSVADVVTRLNRTLSVIYLFVTLFSVIQTLNPVGYTAVMCPVMYVFYYKFYAY